MYSDYETVAEEEGFIVVHPTGIADAAGGAELVAAVRDARRAA